MESSDFCVCAKAMIDYVANYMDNIRDRRTVSNVQPGFLDDLIPQTAPDKPEKWEDVFKDVEEIIMPGVTHWQSPHFHGFFPAIISYEGIIADILSDAIGCIGLSWEVNPSCTELEVKMLDWLGKMIHLPEDFLSGGKGGGVIQSSATEATLLGLLSARTCAIENIKKTNKDITNGEIIDKLVCYSSDQCHVCLEKASRIGLVKYHMVESDERGSVQKAALTKKIYEDKQHGLIPFYCVATLGTIATCAFDNLLEVGSICQDEEIWLHVDAAYAGSAFICPEFRPLLNGVEFANSFNFSPAKWMMVNFDCSALWLKDKKYLLETLNVDPVYYKQPHQEKTVNYMHWQIPGGRRFRSLKLWFVLRMYGIKRLQEHIRKHIALAKDFERYARKDGMFEVIQEVTLGLVCFRLLGSNDLNETLLNRIKADGRIYLTPAKIKDIYFLRFTITSPKTSTNDIKYAWDVIREIGTDVLLSSQ